jgi:small subunit ribosomal protein S17
MESSRALGRKRIVGVVESDNMNKTVVVEVEKIPRHRQYKKYVRTKKRYKAHDEENRCKTGDRVLILETKPLSKEKRWVVKEIVKQQSLLVREEVRDDDTGQFEA